MRAGSAGVKILIKARKGAAESAYLSVRPLLLSQPLHRVEAVFVRSPGFIAKRIPDALRGEAASRVLNGNDIAIRRQELRRSDTNHYGLVFSVWCTFEQHRIAPRLGWEVQVRSEADSVRHGDGNIPPDRTALGYISRLEIRDKLRRDRHALTVMPGIIVCRP